MIIDSSDQNLFDSNFTTVIVWNHDVACQPGTKRTHQYKSLLKIYIIKKGDKEYQKMLHAYYRSIQRQ